MYLRNSLWIVPPSRLVVPLVIIPLYNNLCIIRVGPRLSGLSWTTKNRPATKNRPDKQELMKPMVCLFLVSLFPVLY